MLTSFFNNSKPIHFVFVAVYMAIFYCLSNFLFLETEMDLFFVLKKLAGLVAFLLTMLLLHFIAKRNDLTKDNAYKILLFATFSALFSEALQNTDVIFANFFVVLGIRRVIGLKTERFSKEKIFDGVFWICVASLFSFWTAIFLGIVYFGILIHVGGNYKNWLVPPVAFIAALVLATTAHLLLLDEFYTFQKWFQESNYDFSHYRDWEILFPLSILLALTLWTVVNFIGVLQKVSAVVRPSMVIVLVYLILSIAVAILSPTKNTSEMMFYFVPLSIIVAKYFDDVPDKWFKEALLIIFLVSPFILLFV